ncbi:hypothetical protein DXG01_016212, partial [Tephrocybe rancida]
DFTKEAKAWCTHATFVDDGHVVQTPEQHINWTLRSLVNINTFFLSQLPPEYEMRMNPDLFLRSFSFTRDGQRRRAARWENAPGWRSSVAIEDVMDVDEDFSVERRTGRSEAYVAWGEFQHTVGGHIPYLVAKGKVPALHERSSKAQDSLKEATKHPNRDGRPK